MALVADIINRATDHVRMVGAVRRMAVVAGVCQFVLEFCSIAPLEGVLMAGTADITLLAFKQPRFIAGMRRMTGYTTVFPKSHQVIVGGRHLLLDIVVTPETGIDAHRLSLAFMTVVAPFGIGRMQDILDH